ncbi:MAG: adenosine kinase [Treponema sp.]|nr:adenosine kinase [Treponema sp.]
MADNDLELLCIGNAMVDIFTQGEEGIDRHFNLDENVQHISMDKMRDILSVLPEFTVCSGGGAANVAKIAGCLGIKSGFIGALGAAPAADRENEDSQIRKEIKQFDQFGQLFEEQLEEAGTDTILVEKNTPSGICLIIQLPDGRTKIAASPSAAMELTAADVDEETIKRAQVVVLDGFLLGRKELVVHILELADKYGTAVALDLSAAGLAYERAAEIITYARAYPLIIFMNEDEAKAFYRALSKDREQQEENRSQPAEGLGPEIISLFKDFTANDIFPVLTVKLGIRGAIVFAGGNIFREETIPVIPLETTGAGDAFCAAFLSAWIKDKNLSECAAFGNKAAREVLYVNGTQVDHKVFKNLGKQLR